MNSVLTTTQRDDSIKTLMALYRKEAILEAAPAMYRALEMLYRSGLLSRNPIYRDEVNDAITACVCAYDDASKALPL